MVGDYYERKRVLVDGATGFVGRHCVNALSARGAEVAALSSANHKKESGDSSPRGNTIFAGDVTDAKFVSSVIQEFNPAFIFHFAAVTPATVPDASVPALLHTNVAGTHTVLASAVRHAPQSTSLVFSSSAVYGEGSSHSVTEDCPFNPINEYGASKVAQEVFASAFAQRSGANVVRVRSFNLVGPGEPAGLVCSSIARQIAAAECGLSEPLVRVGRLNAQRDFTDVRDAAAAYLLIGERGKIGEVYNVCSNRLIGIGDILEMLLAMAKIPLGVAERRDANVVGSSVSVLQGNYEKLHRATDWQPRITIEQSLVDLLDWWRATLKEI